MVTVKNRKVQQIDKRPIQQKDTYTMLHLRTYIFWRIIAETFGSLREQFGETEIQEKQELRWKLVGKTVWVDTENEKRVTIKITVKINPQAKGLNVPNLRKIVWDNFVANSLQVLHIKVQKWTSSKRQGSTKIAPRASLRTSEWIIQH